MQRLADAVRIGTGNKPRQRTMEKGFSLQVEKVARRSPAADLTMPRLAGLESLKISG
jgi:hypothetical protein